MEDGRPDGLKKTPWLEFVGPEYMEIAFTPHMRRIPTQPVVYNENRLEPEDSATDNKRQAHNNDARRT